MSKRGIVDDSALESAVDRAANEFYETVKIVLKDGASTKTYKVCNAPYDLTVGSDTFTAFGQLMSFSGFEENSTLEIAKVSVTLSGVATNDPNLFNPVNDFIDLDYTNSPVNIRRVYVNDSGIVGDIEVFKGYIQSAGMAIDSSDTCTVKIDIANHWSDFEREAGRYSNSNSQQRYYPGDEGMEYSKEVQKDIKWKK